MTDRDWDRELAKIDKQIGSMSEEDLRTRGAPPVTAGQAQRQGRMAPLQQPGAKPATAAREPSQFGVMVRVGLAVALAIGIQFWPYSARCGTGLAGYLASVMVVGFAGGWSAVATWRSRWGKAHVLALLIVAWGLALAAVEVLPRVGYAHDVSRVAWVCE